VTRLLAAEVRKFGTIWSTWLIFGITALAVAVFGTIVGFVRPGRRTRDLLEPLRGTSRWFDLVFSTLSIALDLALVLGILCVTGEYRHKTVTPTYLAEPRRGRVVVAKLLASAGGGAVIAVVGGVVALGLGLSVVGAGIGTGGRMLTEYGHVFPGILAGSVLYAVYGVGLGALLKNQVVALVTGLGVAAVVEPIIDAAVPSVGRWLPGQAAQALYSVTAHAGGFGSGTTNLVAWWQGALALLGYGLVLAVFGSLTTLRADVT
jgi:hypothetical protein